MGCFSFLCSTCDKPINSDSFSGEHCILFLMEKGKTLEYMQGQYDSYGRVFKVDTKGLGPHSDEVSYEWEARDWSGVCDLMHNNEADSGIAAYHGGCYSLGATPEVSDGDPEQGWGNYKFTTEGNIGHKVYEHDAS